MMLGLCFYFLKLEANLVHIIFSILWMGVRATIREICE
jgi:hypothetical protein